jgi:hypothetical protein
MSENINESIDIDAKRGTKIGLTGKQIEMARILADPSETRTIKAMCEDEGVPRRTFYNWMNKPEFVEFVNSLVEKYTDAELAGIWGALSRKARSGDTAALKLFFEMKGKYREVTEVNHKIDLSPDELDQRINELMGKVGENETNNIKLD